MIYGKAAQRLTKSIDEIASEDAAHPWQKIEDEIKRAILNDKENINVMATMAEGFLVSLMASSEKADQAAKQLQLDEEQTNKFVHIALLDVTSTAMLRAFALGVHCQQANAEVDLLRTLAD